MQGGAPVKSPKIGDNSVVVSNVAGQTAQPPFGWEQWIGGDIFVERGVGALKIDHRRKRHSGKGGRKTAGLEFQKECEHQIAACAIASNGDGAS